MLRKLMAALLSSSVATTAVETVQSFIPDGPRVFGPAKAYPSVPKEWWRTVSLGEMEREAMLRWHTLNDWYGGLYELDGQHLRTRVEGVSALIRDHVQFAPDVSRQLKHQRGWHHDWQMPDVTLATGSGDCEDLALLAWLAMRALDVDAENMRLWGVWHERLDQAHVVLVVMEPGGPMLTIDSERPHVVEGDNGYTPQWSLGPDGKLTFIRTTEG